MAIKKVVACAKQQAAAAVCAAIARLRTAVRTITLDNGTEFHN